MTQSVRSATSADVETLAALHASSYAEVWPAASLAELLSSPGAFALLAGDEGNPRGFVLARVAGDEAEILTLAVSPETRRRGLGRALVRRAAATAAEQGAATLFLEVAVDNEAALALYGALGFAEKGRRKAYYGRPGRPPTDALVLSAGLPLAH